MILVAGAGSIGQLLAARLQEAGHDVECLVRERFVTPLQDLHVSGHTTFVGPVHAVTGPEGPYDVVFLTCKAHQTVATAQQCLPHLSKDGIVVSLQNGLGNGEKLRQLLGPDRTAVALTANGAYMDAPGHVVHAGMGTTQVGPTRPGHDAAAIKANGLLTDAGLDPDLHDDLRGAVWMKAIVNAALNPVAALHDCSNGEVLSHPDRRALCQAIAKESTALAERARVTLPAEPWPVVEQVLERTADNFCSMVQDVRAKRRTEIEQITGRMVRLNERLLGHMPKSEAVYGRIKDLEATYLGAAEAKQAAWDELEWETEPF